MNYTSASVQFLQWAYTLSQLFSNNGMTWGRNKTVRKCIWDHSLLTECKHKYFALQIILKLQPGCIWKQHLYGSWLFRYTISHRNYLRWLSETQLTMTINEFWSIHLFLCVWRVGTGLYVCVGGCLFWTDLFVLTHPSVFYFKHTWKSNKTDIIMMPLYKWRNDSQTKKD